MATTNADISDLLLWRISGELEEGEEQALQEWARGRSDRSRLLRDTVDSQWIETQWERAAQIDVEASWERFQQKIPGTTRLKRRRKRAFTILMCGIGLILALILLVGPQQPTKVVSPSLPTIPDLSKAKSINLDSSMTGKIVRVGPFVLNFQGNEIILDYQTGQLPSPDNTDRLALLSPSGNKSRLRLPDGVTVLLNARAELDLPLNYGAAVRKVGLKGEASFDVRHMGKPFIVEVDPPQPLTTLFPQGGKLTITDEGTAFDVRANPQDGIIRTLLFSGQIKVQSPGKEPRTVQPGQAYFLDKSGKETVIGLDQLRGATSWRDGEFVFEDEPVDNILQELARWYGVHITYRENLSDSFLVSGPRDKPITYLLEQMKATHHFKYKIQADTIYVSH
ncbi:MAG TPA: FecR domain-containing protein [Puia sp.]